MGLAAVSQRRLKGRYQKKHAGKLEQKQKALHWHDRRKQSERDPEKAAGKKSLENW